MARVKNIDGLRAIAVLAVIFFHASFPGVNGGYIGVDIFFVISGYVITKSILSKKELGTFSIIGFYESRIRRLFPSLALVSISTFFLCFLLTPSDFLEISKSLLSVVTGTANIFFWKTTNYFTKPGEYISFLHTWSAGRTVLLPIPGYFLVIAKISKFSAESSAPANGGFESAACNPPSQCWPTLLFLYVANTRVGTASWCRCS